jgi:hypothetical protein
MNRHEHPKGELMHKYICLCILLLVALAIKSPAEARKWKPKQSDLASDYSQIIDKRANGELIMIFWMAPESVDENEPNSRDVRAVLRDYLLLGVVHAKFSPLGQMEFKIPEEVFLEDSNGKHRQGLAKDSLPPTVIGFSTVLQSIMVQSLGPMGQGIKWLVFDGKGIESCGKGRFWINYASERYNYDTPIPGCLLK